jgi:hypothetical protein
MDSSALAPLLLLGKPEPAVSLGKKYFFELREAGFLGELETSRSVLSGLLSGRVVRHRVIQSGSDPIRLSHRDMLAASGSTPAIHRIEIEWEGFGDAGVGGSAPWRLSLGKAPVDA